MQKWSCYQSVHKSGKLCYIWKIQLWCSCYWFLSEVTMQNVGNASSGLRAHVCRSLEVDIYGIMMNLCGWHALLECECKHPCESGDDDGYKKLNRYTVGVGNMEQAKISPPSDSACGCQPWLPFLPALSSSMPRDQFIRAQPQKTRQGSQAIHKIFPYLSTIHYLAFMDYLELHSSISSYIWVKTQRHTLETKLFGKLIHPHLLLRLCNMPLSC